MGLDIYLRKCADLDAAKAAEKAAEDEKEALLESAGGYEKCTEEQKEEIRAKSKEIDDKHGIKSCSHESIEELDGVDSKIAPEHMFKIGYFRSSYNGAGIENVMRKLGLPTMRDIFQTGDEYEFKPDWDDALACVNDAIQRYEAHLNGKMGKYAVMELRPIYSHGASSEKEAMDMFEEKLSQDRPADFNHFSNANGEFMMSGMKVVAVITKKFTPPANILNSPTSYVVYEKEAPADGKEDWYLTALKIVRESIEHVIAQGDRQNFYLVWSG